MCKLIKLNKLKKKEDVNSKNKNEVGQILSDFFIEKLPEHFETALEQSKISLLSGQNKEVYVKFLLKHNISFN